MSRRQQTTRSWLLMIVLALAGASLLLSFQAQSSKKQQPAAQTAQLSPQNTFATSRLLKPVAPTPALATKAADSDDFLRFYRANLYTLEEAKCLLDTLLNEVDPDLHPKENSYMTPYIRGMIPKVIRENHAGKYELRAYNDFFKEVNGRVSPTTFIMSQMEAKGGNIIPFSYLSLPRLMYEVRVVRKLGTGFDHYMKNWVALAVAHEATHFDRPREALLSKSTSILDEEDRTWNIMGEKAIHPWRLANEPLDPYNIQADEIMFRCGYKTGCPEFRAFLTGNHMSW